METNNQIQMSAQTRQGVYIANQHLRQIRINAGRNFNAFRRMYFRHYNSVPDAVFHGELSGLLYEMTQKRGVQWAIAAPRESAKSTIVTLQYVLYCICYKIEPFILIVSNTNDQAAGLLSDVKKELESNDLLIQDFPNVCEVGKKPGPPRWTQREIITKNGVKVLALGTGQQVRGRRHKEFRPTLIILDDIETDETAQNPENYDKLHDWVTKAVIKAGTGTTNVVFIGTIHHYNSLLAQFTNPNSNPGWNKKIYRSIIAWPERMDLWEKWEKFFNNLEDYEEESGPETAKHFYEANKYEMDKGVQVLWPQKKSFYDLMVMREQEGHYSFDSEMQNEPINPKDCHFNLETIHYWDDRFGSEEELLQSFQGNFELYGACDPSLGKSKRRGDYSAIITIARDGKTGKLYVLDADLARRTPDHTINTILTFGGYRNYQRFCIETNQFQSFMKDVLEQRSSEQGIYVPIEGIDHTGDKKGRIELLEPLVKSGVIQFSRKHRLLLEQMKFFPKGSHDDGLDALEMAVRIAKEGCGPLVWDL